LHSVCVLAKQAAIRVDPDDSDFVFAFKQKLGEATGDDARFGRAPFLDVESALKFSRKIEQLRGVECH